MQLNLDEMMREVQEEAGREDVVTLAKKLRAGDYGLRVESVCNGFVVTIDHSMYIVATKPGDVGLLIRTLYSSDLEVEGNVKRLRRLTGMK